jgi:steroid delta-isomerase-like uncharacterized protein
MAEAKEVMDRWFEAANNHDPHRVDDLITEDCVLEAPGAPPFKGPEQIKAWMQGFFDAFPDVSHPIHTLEVMGDIAVAELHAVGTNTGPLMTPNGELPPTGNKLNLRSAAVMSFKGDRISSVHIYFDQVEFLSQLGLMPAPAG